MKILVVDDHPLVRDAMAELVTHLGGSVDVLQAPDCASALALARVHPDLDLVLLDLNLPGLRGIPALQRFRSEHPSAPIVVVSASRDHETVAQVIRQGAVGFIPKSSGRDTIVNALRLVLAGSVYVPPEAALPEDPQDAPMRSGPQGRSTSAAELGLTPRQAQVLALLMKGRANKEICRDLGLAERTVKAHLTAVLNVLKATSRTQAVIAANRLGLDIEVLLASQ
jgi:DNA-binding NarL/FixJ family response regulator